MNPIAMVCANFGAIDKIQALPSHDGVDAFYYTDEATRSKASAGALASWSQVLIPNYPRHDFDARLRSRYFKHQIHRLDEVRDHRWLVWTDASLRFQDTTFLTGEAERLSQLPPEKRVLLVPHPQRRTVREEYEFIRGEIERGNEDQRARYGSEKMTEQMEYFRQRGWNTETRLFCGGFWMVENSELFARCWDDWWNQNLRFGMMDQLSLPVMLDQRGCEPQVLDVLIWKNRYFNFMFRNGLPGLKLS